MWQVWPWIPYIFFFSDKKGRSDSLFNCRSVPGSRSKVSLQYRMILCRMSAFVRGPISIAISCNFYIVISVQRHLVALHEDIYMNLTWRLPMAYSFRASTGTRTWLTFPPCRMNKLSGYPTFSTLDIRQLFPSIPGTNNSWMHLVKTTENHPPVCTTPHWHCTRPSHQHLDNECWTSFGEREVSQWK